MRFPSDQRGNLCSGGRDSFGFGWRERVDGFDPTGVVVRYLGAADHLVRPPEHYAIDREATDRLRHTGGRGESGAQTG